MISKNRLIYLFFKMRRLLFKSGKFNKLSDKVLKQIKNAHFFNTNKIICIYNHYNSVIINDLLLDKFNYSNNIFVFPKFTGSGVLYYRVSEPNDLIIDTFGVKDVTLNCFPIDKNKIDVILVSGMSFDYNHNWLNTKNNEDLYNAILKDTDILKLGVCFNCQIYKKDLPESKYKVDALFTEDGFVV